MHDRTIRRMLPVNQVVLILAGILLLYLLIAFGQQIRLSQQRRQELVQIEQKITLAQEEGARLKEQVDYARSDDAAEEWARENGLAKTGEIPVIVMAPAAEPVLTPEEEPASPEPTTSRDAWWELLFGTR